MTLRTALQAALQADTAAGGLCAATSPLLGGGAASVFPQAGAEPPGANPWLLVDLQPFTPPFDDQFGTTQTGLARFRAFDEAAQQGQRLARVVARVQGLFRPGTCFYDDGAGFAYWCRYAGVSQVIWDAGYQQQQQWLDIQLWRNVNQ